MTNYLYSNLDDLESHHGIDFSEDAKEWSPDDSIIYHATNKSLVSTAGRLINDYCERTFDAYPNTPDAITWVCNEVVLRLIRRRNAILQAKGHTSYSDPFMGVSVDPTIYPVELSLAEKARLEPYRQKVVLAISGD